MSFFPHDGHWFVAAGVAFHATDAGTIDFADPGPAEGEWVTIGGGPGPNGEQHVGGFPVKVTGGTPDADGTLRGGTIVGGKLAARLGLHGLTADRVDDRLAALNAHRKAGKTADAIRAGQPLTIDQQKTLNDLTGTKRSKAKPAAFTATARGDLLAAPILREMLGGCSKEEFRAAAAFLIRAVGSDSALAVPAIRLLRLVRERLV